MNSSLSAKPIQTSIYRADIPLEDFLWQHLEGQLQEKTIIAITSKIISVSENRLVQKSQISKAELIQQEADVLICETIYGVSLTIKDGILIPSAGIDESNSEDGAYILYPRDSFASARQIWEFLRNKSGIKNLGIIITDSHTHPLRRGVTGIALAHWGFKATRNLVGDSDLFGRKITMTSVNVVDSLAVAAVFVMGEAAECQPIALVEATDVVFCDETNPSEIQIPLDQDLYGPLISPTRT